MTTPKVSVIIPAYNEEAYIGKTLEALCLQTYSNFEVLVVNNASTDRTAEFVTAFICRHNLHFRFRLLHERQQGTQFARECGRRMASGEIIAQLDADCLPPANWISKGVRLLQEKGAAAVAGPYDYFDSSILVRTVTTLGQLFLLQPLNSILQFFQKGGVLLGGNAFIQAALLKTCGGHNTAISFYGDDVDIAMRVRRFGIIHFTSAILVKSSSRRYRAAGFFRVQAKYAKAFWQTLFQKGLSRQESMELVHPR